MTAILASTGMSFVVNACSTACPSSAHAAGTSDLAARTCAFDASTSARSCGATTTESSNAAMAAE